MNRNWKCLDGGDAVAQMDIGCAVVEAFGTCRTVRDGQGKTFAHETKEN